MPNQPKKQERKVRVKRGRDWETVTVIIQPVADPDKAPPLPPVEAPKPQVVPAK